MPPRPTSKPPPAGLLAHALSYAANAVLLTERSRKIIWANEAFCRLSGFVLPEVLGNTPALVRSGMQSEMFYAELWRTILAGNAWRGRMVERRKDGSLKSDTVARFGGDEFAILLPELMDADVAIALAHKLIHSIGQPFVIAQQEMHVGVSIGIAMYPTDGDTPDELMAKADEAMYLAKKGGCGNYQFPVRPAS